MRRLFNRALAFPSPRPSPLGRGSRDESVFPIPACHANPVARNALRLNLIPPLPKGQGVGKGNMNRPNNPALAAGLHHPRCHAKANNAGLPRALAPSSQKTPYET
jgi:hypothetical protein